MAWLRAQAAQGVRRTLIVNYVSPEWRATEELAQMPHAA